MQKQTDTMTETVDKKEAAFQAPRHWVEMDELSPSYWEDEKNQKARGQEFSHKPVETLEMLERLDSKGVARRDFLTIMGASMAMTSFACVRRPMTKIIPYVVKPDEVTPGVANYYASTDPESGSGLLVRTREGRPVKIEGNPDHPVSRGKASAQQQASLLSLYDPERLRAPAKVEAGVSLPLSWGEADAQLAEALKGAKTVRVLSRPMLSPSLRRVTKEFLAAFSSGRTIEYRSLEEEDLAEAQEASYGGAVIPRYRFDKADVVVSLGADYLGTWVSPVEHASDWATRRRLSSKSHSSAKMSKLYTFEPMMTITGAQADERYPVQPSDMVKVGMAVAHELIVKKRRTSFASNPTVVASLRSYSPAKVAKELGNGITEAKIGEIADNLWKARGSSLVVAGSAQTKSEEGLQLQVAANLLNSALENEGSTVDGLASPRQARGDYRDVARLVREMEQGKVDALLIHDLNPMYDLPAEVGFEAAAAKVGTVVHFSDRLNETSMKAGYVLPLSHYLEDWGDAEPRKDLFSLQQPTVSPLFDTRGFGEALIALGRAGVKVSGLASRAKNWHEYVKGAWRETLFSRFGGGKSFEAFWVKVVQKGVLDARGSKANSSSPRRFKAASLGLVSSSTASRDGLQFVTYESMAMGDGRMANNAWLQEMPDPITTVTWDNFVAISPKLAHDRNLHTHDVVKLESGGKTIKLPVYVQPGVHPNVVAVAAGYGRELTGKVGSGVGARALDFATVKGNRVVLSGHPVTLTKTGARYELAMTQGHHKTEGRPIVNDMTLDQFKSNPATEDHTDPHLRMKKIPTMWTKHEYKKQKWGLSIDLNSCTGCGACVIACQAENNTPTVGRDRVRVGREMHWIRIDRYYSGSPDRPDVLFEPMMCQHCDNAPCEVVCPVLATIHSDEGLNQMVYNRCVGTRYCQNNCPYKVRRFNFFDHWKDYKETMNMVWNPDVTVRSRGVMEKCTFCVQRINAARDAVRTERKRLRDGEVKTACQQTCPTDAITFGDLNDSKSRVSEMRNDQRNFRVLEILNTLPAVSYLSKVRNKEEEEHSHGEHH
jgi:Fe-S-cluster-containing dehydrogenase component/anaerobic selenocysteine-containing dehydrogenase